MGVQKMHIDDGKYITLVISVTFLVDDDKALLVVTGADLPLELDNLGHPVLDELPFGRDQFFAVFGSLVKESRVHLCLLVLHAHLNKKISLIILA